MEKLKFYTLLPSQSALSSITEYLIGQNSQDPFLPSSMHIILPTRRTVRKLKQLLLENAPRSSLLLPKIQAINDLTPPLGTDIPPEMPSALRLGAVMKLIEEEKDDLKTAPSVELAYQLCSFMDRLQLEEADLTRLDTIIPDQFSHHWQISLRFLRLIQQKWPAALNEYNYIESYVYCRHVWDSMSRLWQQNPPSHAVITLGLTGNVPAVGRLLKCIAALPLGQVILPGFDMSLTQAEWRSIKPSHPQYCYKRFFEREKIDLSSVQKWTETKACSRERDMTLSAMMKDDLSPKNGDLTGIELIELETPQHEAECVALIIREKLAAAQQTIAVVSPDKKFGKRLRTELQRWNIDIDDSAGVPLSETALGQLILLTAELKEFEEDPTHTLAILKHPYTLLGFSRTELLRRVRGLEAQVLRAQKTVEDLSSSLLDRISNHCQEPQKKALVDLIRSWDAISKPLLNLKKKSKAAFTTILETHLELLELLSSKKTLWENEAGEVLVPHILNLKNDSKHFESITLNDYSQFLRIFLDTIILHEPFSHPRVQLLGPIEARLVEADWVILTNMNEGLWPKIPSLNPWLNRSMQLTIGLPDQETEIGQEALDFTLALGNKNVILTRALRIDGTPTTPLRWLLRLKTVASIGQKTLAYPHSLHVWRSLLDQPAYDIKIQAPSPAPPLSIRPLKLSISDIEWLISDAYVFYAKNILKLIPLDQIEIVLTPKLFGIWMHRVLQNHPTAETLAQFTEGKNTNPIWLYPFERIKEWLLNCPEFKDASGQLFTEKKLTSPWDPLEIIGKADRIQVKSDGIEIIDYKTGVIPTQQELKNGHAPQLPLLGFLAKHAFNQPIIKLAYWDLKNQEIRTIDNPESMIHFYEQTLEKLLMDYLTEETEFKSSASFKEERNNPYHHLKRAQEWLNSNN